MPPTPDHPEVIVWTDAPPAHIVRQILGQMTELKILAVGCPRSSPRPVELADAFSAAAFDDLRQMIVQLPAQYLFLATTNTVKPDDIAAVIQQQTDVLSLEPLLDAAPSSDDSKTLNESGRIHYLPRFRQCPAYLAAADPQQALSSIRSIQITSVGRAHVASLAARLTDALDMLIALLGLPDSIDAAYVGPSPDAPQSLRALTGHITANLRFSDQAAASLLLSDQSHIHHRAAAMIGSDATLLLNDLSYQLIGNNDTGQPILLDQLLPDPRDASRTPQDASSLIVHQWRRLLTHRPVDDRSVDPRALLAVAETVLLAARTAQPESPRKLFQMAGLT